MAFKTGRLEYYIPSPATVSRDVKKVFANARKHIAKMLQEHEGTLSFTMDAWTSPNHKVFVAVTVHFENNRVPLGTVLYLHDPIPGNLMQTLLHLTISIQKSVFKLCLLKFNMVSSCYRG